MFQLQSPRFASLVFALSALALPLTTAVIAQQTGEQPPSAQFDGGGLDLNSPEGYIAANRKIQCSQEDGQSVFYSWEGRAWSRVAGERDRLLFAVEGMSVRQCVRLEDPALGTGYRLISREIMLYKDPRSGEVLRKWDNPWTGKTVDVIHVANDPVNSRPTFGRRKDGGVNQLNPVIRSDTFFLSFEIPLFYRNPLAGEYQEYVGNDYHSAEIFNFIGRMSQLTDPKVPSIDVEVSWVRMAPWLPWMLMGSRPGMMYFNAVGTKLSEYEDLSETMKQEIDTFYRHYRNPPPADDTRPNETSWTHFKKIIDLGRESKQAETK